jgi:hypothetical protein
VNAGFQSGMLDVSSDVEFAVGGGSLRRRAKRRRREHKSE